MDGSDRKEGDNREDAGHYYSAVLADASICDHRHGTIEGAWDCGTSAVVVTDSLGQHWSLHQAYKWGIINIYPIR